TPQREFAIPDLFIRAGQPAEGRTLWKIAQLADIFLVGRLDVVLYPFLFPQQAKRAQIKIAYRRAVIFLLDRLPQFSIEVFVNGIFSGFLWSGAGRRPVKTREVVLRNDPVNGEQ